MNMKKEISLGDLFRRKPKTDGSTSPALASGDAKTSFLKKEITLPGIGGASIPKRLVGLKLGASQIAAAEIVNNGAPELVQVVRTALEPGVIVAGELRDPEALSASLAEFFKASKLPRRGVRLGVASNRIGVRAFDLVGVDDPKQLTNAIRFRAQEVLPIPLNEAVLDYQVLGETVGEGGERTHRVLLVVAYRELVDRYVRACTDAGIQLAGIDLEAFALLRALAAPRVSSADESEPAAARVAVSIGHDRSTLAVSDGRICEFTRVIEWGGGALDVALARVLDVAPSEAEPIKRSLSVVGDDVPEGLTEESARKAREAIRREVQSFAREVVSSLTFYQSQAASLGIADIALTGGTAHLNGLAEELQRLVGVTVRPGDPFARVRVNKSKAVDEQLGSLTVAIGLGIED